MVSTTRKGLSWIPILALKRSFTNFESLYFYLGLNLLPLHKMFKKEYANLYHISIKKEIVKRASRILERVAEKKCFRPHKNIIWTA